jgi:hypothetical protein
MAVARPDKALFAMETMEFSKGPHLIHYYRPHHAASRLRAFKFFKTK